MEVSMLSLAQGLLTAWMLGFLMRTAFFAAEMTLCFLFGEYRFRGRAWRILSEIGWAVILPLSACVLMLFLYYINSGILRWFLCGSVLAAYSVLSYCFYRRIRTHVRANIVRIRAFFMKAIRAIFRPLMILMRWAVSPLCRLARKIALSIRRKYDKIKLYLKDRKHRRRMERAYRGLCLTLRREQKHEH